MSINCYQLPGRIRQICEGFDDFGAPITMSQSDRLSILKNFFPAAEHTALEQHLLNENTKGMRGLGDLVAAGIKVATFGKVRPCGGCRERQNWLNRLVPFFETAKNTVPFLWVDEATPRSLLMHLWPTSNSAWKWNLDRIIRRKHLWTGKVVLGVAIDNKTATVGEVREYAAELNPEIVVVQNNPRIREGATLHKMLARIEDQPGITFYCHGKGARHGNFTAEMTVRRWTDAMYWACLDQMPLVYEHLRTYGMTGPFKRYGMFKTPGNHRWHYSGSFYWFRNATVFDREWKRMDRQFFAVESWPALLFSRPEGACLFMDHAGDLYQHSYWINEVQPALDAAGYESGDMRTGLEEQ